MILCDFDSKAMKSFALYRIQNISVWDFKEYLNSANFCSHKALLEVYPCVSSDVKVCLTDYSNFRSSQVWKKQSGRNVSNMAIFERTLVQKIPKIDGGRCLSDQRIS